MKNSIQMVIVLAVISLLSGLALGGLHQLTFERAQNNILKFKKIPAVADLYEVVAGKLPPAEREAVEEGLLAEKRFVDLGDGEPVLFFIVRKEGEPFAVAIEDYGQGFGGDLGVMVGFEVESGNLLGVGITTMAETPGVGTKVREESFLAQFLGMSKDTVFKVEKDGGEIDAVTGATISVRAVAQGIERAAAFFEEHREAILAAIDQPLGGAQ
jgi:Na+-translocating ferredoxin:NAD+ oxidoreductase subunit G